MERNPLRNGAAPAGARGYGFLLRPRWLLSHLFVLALVVLMVNLGFWQLRRLDQRKELNDEVRSHTAAEVVAFPADLTDGADLDDLEWRRFSVTGRYRPDADVLVANRTVDGQPGYWIVTPLDPDDGGTPVAVVRGFVTRTLVAGGDLSAAAAPPGTVTVVGYAQESRSGGRFATDSGEAGLPEISRVDLGQLEDRWQSDLAPLWVQLAEQQPALTGDALTPVPLPPRDDGPHLSYAIQWFIFSTIAVVGYPLILRRHARGSDDDDDEIGDPRRNGSATPTTGVRADTAIQ